MSFTRKPEDPMPLNNRRIFNAMPRLSRMAPKFLRVSLLLVVSLGLGAAGNLPQMTAGSAGSLALTAGAPINRELSAGDTQLFEISLDSSQLLRFSINKGDLAMSLVIYGPAGQKMLEQVSHGYEVLDVSVPTDAAGIYRLEIRSLEHEDAIRKYELEVETVWNATAQDRKNFAARQAIAGASLMRAGWTETSLRQAIEKYDEAALIWLSSGDLRSAAGALMGVGEVCLVLGEYREALNRYQQATEVARSVGAKAEESEALSQVGRLYSYLGNNDEAQRRLTSALGFLSEHSLGNQPGTVKQAHAEALSNLGEVSYSKGDLVKASAHFEHALKLFAEIGDRKGEARAHLFLGYIAGSLGRAEKALSRISQALDLYRASTDKTGEGLSLAALGTFHSAKREEESAIRMHREAMEIFRAIGDQQSEAIALTGLGQSFENLGKHETALESYETALKLSRSLDFSSVANFKIAKVYRLLGDHSRALAYYEQCLKLSRAAKKRRTEANALNDIAVMYASQSSREKTVRQYGKILKFYAAITDRRGQVTALNNLGDFLLRLGEKKNALRSYKQALSLSEHAGDQGLLISTLYNIARAHRDLGALEDALSSIKQSIEIIEDLRTNVASPDFRTSYFAGVRKQYDLWIDILMQLDRVRPGQGYAAKALLASESARARSLIDMLTEAGADIRQGVDPALLERKRELQGLLRSQAEYQLEISISGKNQAESSEAARQIDQLRTEYQELEAKLRNQNPRFLTLTQPAPLSLEQIQAELRDGNTILLEYALGDERSYLWAVTSESLRTYELPSRATLDGAAREVYKLLTARQAIGEKIDAGYQANVEESDRLYHEKALGLSQILLGPVAEQLGTKTLVVVTEGVLQYIPFDALPTPQKQIVGANTGQTLPTGLPQLIATNEIVTLPSISTLAAFRQEKHKISSSNKIVAVLADPVFSSNDDRVQNGTPPQATDLSGSAPSLSQPALRSFEGLVRNGGTRRLVHASAEADAILATTPRGTGMVARGFDATRETAMSPLIGEYKIVHFATHGFFNSEHPELSGIVLTMVNQDGSRTNGLMPLHDIYNLNLSADLVVLSACDTALGNDIKGEGLVGLTRGFMSSGSRSVVASLWKVDDRVTAMLMSHFYKSMLEDGLPPAAALRSAKQRIRQEKMWRAPYFWAGFVLQGEYRERIVVHRESWLRSGLIVSLAAIVISSGVFTLQRRRRRAHLGRQ
jgi:CHAT domain-containing protein/Flp pilus assembly protein TadD